MVPMLALTVGLVLLYLGFCVLVGSFIAAGSGESSEGQDVLWPH